MPPVCDVATHERLKRDSSWPRLPYVGELDGFGDVPNCELRNCPECKSTLAREVRR